MKSMDNNNKWLILLMDLPSLLQTSKKATVNQHQFFNFLVNYRQISLLSKKTLATNTKGKKRVGFAIKNRLKVMEILLYFILFYVLGERFLTVYVYWLQFF